MILGHVFFAFLGKDLGDCGLWDLGYRVLDWLYVGIVRFLVLGIGGFWDLAILELLIC